MHSNYDKFPFVDSHMGAETCAVGWKAIAERIMAARGDEKMIVCLECYPGASEQEIAAEITSSMAPGAVFFASEAYHSPQTLRERFARELTDDPVFGRLSGATIHDFFDPVLLQQLQSAVASCEGTVLLVGTGASLLSTRIDCLIYADMARWELQLRQRKNLIGNLGLNNLNDRAAEKYKRAFFLDWRVADRLKLKLLLQADYVLDTNTATSPKMISGEVFYAALALVVRAPLRLVPFFDPGPWGGQWMRESFELPDGPPNYAWCFDCVPEENSLLLGFGEHRFEIPSQDLVLLQPRGLMGDAVHARFGLDFPIRFDLLDTMGGGNLSFQVHPLTEYIQEHFGMAYTQDESYYLLDAGSDAAVFLGLKENIDRSAMEADLRQAQTPGGNFAVDRYANRIPATKHDHFLIPAGTPHCSGANSMVLEISATPYIFTFKLWDWGRVGLDGRPRPVHLDHGLRNLAWQSDTDWVAQQLVNTVTRVGSGEGWVEERTGLHKREFIETRRHWFTATVDHDTSGGVNVLNLIEGSAVVVESCDGSFPAFEVHYAETFLVPAAVGRYSIRPQIEGERCGTIKASVRTGERSDFT